MSEMLVNPIVFITNVPVGTIFSFSLTIGVATTTVVF